MSETYFPNGKPEPCHHCHKDCGGTCLGLTGSTQMKTDDPAYWMLKSGNETPKTVHRDGCYICEDPEFAMMGLPLCRYCPTCSANENGQAGHIPADDTVCSDCGYDAYASYMEEQERAARETG